MKANTPDKSLSELKSRELFLEPLQITLFVNTFAPTRCRTLIQKTKQNEREIIFLCAFRTLDPTVTANTLPSPRDKKYCVTRAYVGLIDY